MCCTENAEHSTDLSIDIDEEPDSAYEVDEVNQFTFVPLQANEGLDCEITDLDKGKLIIISAYDGNIRRELFRVESEYFSDLKDVIQFGSKIGNLYKSLVLDYVTYNSSDYHEGTYKLWLVDGKDGLAKIIYISSIPYEFKISDDAEYLFIQLPDEENDYPERTPLFYIYKIDTIVKLKEVRYMPFEGVLFFVTGEIQYSEDSFFISLYNDQENAGVTLQIPIFPAGNDVIVVSTEVVVEEHSTL
jgi:hypothetical protein